MLPQSGLEEVTVRVEEWHMDPEHPLTASVIVPSWHMTLSNLIFLLLERCPGNETAFANQLVFSSLHATARSCSKVQWCGKKPCNTDNNQGDCGLKYSRNTKSVLGLLVFIHK